MRFIAGLGNPGRRYRRTRHNIGQRVLDRLAEAAGAAGPRSLFRADTWRIEGDDPILLIRPRTYMNECGPAVRDVLGYFRGDPEALLVIHDDMDLEIGRIRFRRGGSSGGHRGVASVIECLGAPGFARLKLGIGRPPESEDAVDHVLTVPPAKEQELLAAAEARGAAAAEDWIRRGLDWCMNAYNQAEVPGS